MYTLEEFYSEYPIQRMNLENSVFSYRYYKNPDAEATLVLLTGGTGFSDLLYQHFKQFTQKFSVITFDYQLQYMNIDDFLESVSAVLKELEEKVWLVGQSLGGFIAQIFAKEYPDQVEGMILSNTGSLSADMSKEAYDSLLYMMKLQRKMKVLVNSLPFPIYKKIIEKMLLDKKKMEGYSEDEKRIMEDMGYMIISLMDKPYENHMIDMMLDLENHFGMKPEDFAYLEKRVLLMLSSDDKTFHEDVKKSLTDLMTGAELEEDMQGGHLALLFRLDEYVEKVSQFIEKAQG